MTAETHIGPDKGGEGGEGGGGGGGGGERERGEEEGRRSRV